MDIRSGKDYPAGALSNFSPYPFTVDGVECNSMEGFLQSLKFKNPDMQKHVCTLVGLKAKRMGANKNWQQRQTLYWRGEEINRSSREYSDLLWRAYRNLYHGNQKAKNALLATGDANLTHSIGRSKKSETVLTKNEFCSILTRIREELRQDLDFTSR